MISSSKLRSAFELVTRGCVLYRGRSTGESDGYEHDGRFLEAEGAIMRGTGVDPSGTGEASSSSCSSAGVDNETVILSLKERVRWLEQRLCEKVSRRLSFGECCLWCAVDEGILGVQTVG